MKWHTNETNGISCLPKESLDNPFPLQLEATDVLNSTQSLKSEQTECSSSVFLRFTAHLFEAQYSLRHMRAERDTICTQIQREKGNHEKKDSFTNRCAHAPLLAIPALGIQDLRRWLCSNLLRRQGERYVSGAIVRKTEELSLRLSTQNKRLQRSQDGQA